MAYLRDSLVPYQPSNCLIHPTIAVVTRAEMLEDLQDLTLSREIILVVRQAMYSVRLIDVYLASLKFDYKRDAEC